MEGVIGATKRVLVVMMLLLAAVVVVQAQDQVSPAPSPGSPKPQERGFVCPLRCAIKCLPSVRLGPVKYGLCLGLCLIECINFPSPNEVVYDCTEKCAVLKTTIFKPDSYDEVGSYVQSCYEGCSNKSTAGHGL